MFASRIAALALATGIVAALGALSGCGDLLGADFDDGHLKPVADAAPSTEEGGSGSGALDASTSHVLLFGGLMGDGKSDDVTWTWDGTWTKRDVTVHPPGRNEHAMATLGHTVVLFGGSRDETVLGDTWVWDGSRWEEKHPAHSPEARFGHEMATVNGRVVLYGGAGVSGQSVKDPQVMWAWDGTDWTAGAIPSPPAVTADAGGILDFRMAGSKDTLLLNKSSSEMGYTETWLYRGGWTNLGTWAVAGDMVTALPKDAGFFMVGYEFPDEAAWVLGGDESWKRFTTKPSPPARGGSALVTFHGKVMLFGGGDIGEASIFYNDTWIFDGTAWSVTPPSAFDPPLRYRHAMAAIE